MRFTCRGSGDVIRLDRIGQEVHDVVVKCLTVGADVAMQACPLTYVRMVTLVTHPGSDARFICHAVVHGGPAVLVKAIKRGA